MATLVLTAVGTAIGGPVGGALGAVLGQAADARLFGGAGGRGPRLAELRVQTSSYGSAIPKIFGRMRVAGTVIWATDIRETRKASGGGKGRPGATEYSYSASFAVALSARPIRTVRRVWADGKLLRGAEGDWKGRTGFRLHPGTEDQPVDPLIASVEGAGRAPAYRGIAYAVFEDLELGDFGNRLPSLNFEVQADDGPSTAGAIAAALSAGALGDGGSEDGGEGGIFLGYAASGSARAAIGELLQVAPAQLRDDGARLTLGGPRGAPRPLRPEEAALPEAGARRTPERPAFERATGAAGADAVELSFHDPARDYQAGLQRATEGGPGRRAEAIALPAALEAGAAKALAQRRLERGRAERSSGRLPLPWADAADIRPGDRVRVAGATGAWRVTEWTLEAMGVRLDLVREPGGALTATAADAGRATREPDVAHGRTLLLPVDAPLYPLAGDGAPALFAAAAGDAAGWRGAALDLSSDGGASWRAAGRTAEPAVLGRTRSILRAAPSTVWDEASALEVELAHDAMWLAGADEAALLGGANLALVGRELLQFGEAAAVGPRRFRLRRLLRGRLGTEEWAEHAAPGEPFLLVEPATLARVPLRDEEVGRPLLLAARGIGDAEPVERAIAFAGEALRPPPPAQLRGEREGGALRLAWARRSRGGWSWSDGVDAPLGEEREAYRLRLLAAGRAARTVELAAPGFLYTATMRAADGVGEDAPVRVEVVQLGTRLASRAAAIEIS